MTITILMIMMMMLMMIIGKVKSGWNKRAYSDDNGHSCLSQSPDKNSYFCILGERIKHWTCSFTNKCRWLNEKKGLSPEKRKLFVINGGCLYSGVRETIFFPSKGYITITLNRIQGKGKNKSRSCRNFMCTYHSRRYRCSHNRTRSMDFLKICWWVYTA